MAATPAAARRLIPGGAVVAIAAALAATSVLRAPDIAVWLAIPGAAGVLVAALAMISRRPSIVVAAVLLLGAEYGAALVWRGNAPDFTAPVVGVALLVMAELAMTACDWRERGFLAHGAVETRRWLIIAAIAAGGVAIGSVALAAVGTASPGYAGLAAGGIAAVALIALLGWLIRDALERH
jgi:hypothetical protein